MKKSITNKGVRRGGYVEDGNGYLDVKGGGVLAT